MRVAVVGGTGTAGRHVVVALERAGHDPVVLARSRGVDVLTGEGLDAALEGVTAVVDAGNVETVRASRSVDFFRSTTRRLLDAEQRAGVQHHVVLSIVGIDDVPFGYYDGKKVQEQEALSGPVPATVLRTTQFHEFPGQMIGRGRTGPVAVVPRSRIQPVAASEVGARLAELAVGPPLGRARDLGGPEVHELPDLARRLARARSDRLRVLGVRLPGAAGKAMAGDGLLPGPDAELRGPTWEQWLSSQVLPSP